MRRNMPDDIPITLSLRERATVLAALDALDGEGTRPEGGT
jgi:hypothetical protein